MLATEYEKLLPARRSTGTRDAESFPADAVSDQRGSGGRRKAAEKQNEYFESIGGKLDELYDKLVKNRTEQAKKLALRIIRSLDI